MKKRVIIHEVSNPKIGHDVRTACGITATVETTGVGAMQLIDESGSRFFATTHAEIVTCKKCNNLATIGTIHASRTANTTKRTVDRPRRYARS